MFHRPLRLGCTVGILVALVIGTASAQPPSRLPANVPAKPVTVVNPPSQPVPVQVGNTSANPVPVQVVNPSSGEQDSELTSQGVCNTESNSTVSVSVYTVPTDKRLLITDMSVYAQGASSNISGASHVEIQYLYCEVGAYRRYFSLYHNNGSNLTTASAGDTVNILANPGDTISCTHTRANLGNISGTTCGYFQGWLMSVP
jgi:hypothetical protein